MFHESLYSLCRAPLLIDFSSSLLISLSLHKHLLLSPSPLQAYPLAQALKSDIGISQRHKEESFLTRPNAGKAVVPKGKGGLGIFAGPQETQPCNSVDPQGNRRLCSAHTFRGQYF